MNDEARWLSLATAMRREVSTHFPNWTDSNDHDPGITLLNLFAWLTDQLLREQTRSDPERIAAARRLATSASIWVNAESDASSEPLLRVNYFEGKLLTADDLRDEQMYFRQRLRRMNLRLHGRGVLSGLSVSIKGTGDAASIEISPGVAIDPSGEEIVLVSSVTAPLPVEPEELYVEIRFVERPCTPVPTTDNSAPAQYSRIAETCETLLSPVQDPHAITIAYLRRTSDGWSVADPPN
ncbi:MAG: hypothetical protein ACJ8MH_04620 [Povalibacter sp.]